MIIKLLIRIDRKLCSGVDDSNGTIGGFIQECVQVLEDYATIDRTCIDEFYALTRITSCFDWEIPLVGMIKYRDHTE